MFKLQLSLAALVAACFTVVSSDVQAAGNASQPSICNRPCWGARAPGGISYMSALNRAIIHHTANAGEFNTTSLNTSKANMRAIQNYHMDVRGWSDIGYHFLSDKLGNIFEGRHASMGSLPRGAHDGTNSNSFGFTWMGYFHTPYNQTPTTAQRNALYDVIAWRMPNGWSPYGSGTYNGKTVGRVDGHRSVNATACPGDLGWQFVGTNYNGGEARNAINSRINSVNAQNYIIDNTSAGFSVTGSWATGTGASDKYGTNYRYKSTDPSSQPAQWALNITNAGTYDISAWWAAGTNRSAQAPYILPNGASAPRNQQANGGKWNLLGTQSLAAGSRNVKLSVWAPTGFVVIADAVKFYGPK